MIPLLIVSKDERLIKNYVDDLRSDSLFFEITPSLKEYSIEDIKNIIKETKIFNQEKRVYFLANFDLSSIPAQNSFLKLLEEPPSNVQFVLSTDNKNNLLPTIVSRTKVVKLQNKAKKAVIDKLISDGIDDVLNQKKATIPLLLFKVTDNDSAKRILLQIIEVFQTKLTSDTKAATVLKKVLWLNKFLESNNLNPQLTVDEALIFISKTYRIK